MLLYVARRRWLGVGIYFILFIYIVFDKGINEGIYSNSRGPFVYSNKLLIELHSSNQALWQRR